MKGQYKDKNTEVKMQKQADVLSNDISNDINSLCFQMTVYILKSLGKMQMGASWCLLSFTVQFIIHKPQTFCVLQSVARIGQTGTKSVFSQSGNSREVTPVLVAQTQSSGPQTRYLLWCHYLILFSFSSYNNAYDYTSIQADFDSQKFQNDYYKF